MTETETVNILGSTLGMIITHFVFNLNTETKTFADWAHGLRLKLQFGSSYLKGLDSDLD